MSRSPIRSLTVSAVIDLPPCFRRLELSGESLVGFPSDSEGGYIKLRLPDSRGGEVLRTYTIAYTDKERQVIGIDFVMHDESGPAVDFARGARVGTEVTISGPGPAKPIDLDADWFLIAGDLSAVPAIRFNIAQLPDDARGYLLLELPSQDAKPSIDMPAGLTLSLFVRPEGARGADRLVEALSEVEWLEGNPAVWVAGELSSVLKARHYLRESMGLSRSRCYVSSYWQEGYDSDSHKRAKKVALGAQ